MASLVDRLRESLRSVIRGKDREIDFVLTAFLGGGHLLLNDVPGVGKTTLAKALARAVGGVFRRIQFTPDLLPADILGGSVYNPREGTFSMRKGPVFANVLLADEINRASPRTQSSLLEAMAEEQVSIEGERHALPDPFWVVATQNPVEFHGTYPLPEAQLDRFGMELSLGYPAPDAEAAVLREQQEGHPVEKVEPVCEISEAVEARAEARRVHVDPDLSDYAVALTTATREEPRFELGVSPRGSIALYRMAQARAFLDGRDHVEPDDIKETAIACLAHRVVLETKAKYSGVTRAAVLEEILDAVPVPT